MGNDLLTTTEAARRLGISRGSLYEWLAQSDAGGLIIRGQPVTIDYLQGGAHGQGRISIEAKEIDRLRELMRVRPHRRQPRRKPTIRKRFPGITVDLGRPER